MIKSSSSYFALSKKELAQALFIIESSSSELDDYDISYGYDEDLNEIPNSFEDMNRYAEVLIAHSRIEFEKPEGERDWLQMSASLGMAGSLKKITGQLKDAEKLLLTSLQIISQKNLPDVYRIQQSIRLYDTHKRLGKYREAIQGLSKLTGICSKDKSLSKYLDVALQHLGKAQFMDGQFSQALLSFQKALGLRIKKQEPELIDSSQTAVEICQARIQQQEALDSTGENKI